MKILGIETSSPIFSLCLHNDEDVLYEYRRRRDFGGHRDALIFEEAKRVIDSAGGKNIGAIAISIGPGMFTSLRVGLGLAKGIALVNNTPVVAVNTLDVIGIQPSYRTSPVVAVINAHRGEIYAASYEKGKRTSDYYLATPEEVLGMHNNYAMIVGPGVEILSGIASRYSNVEIKGDDCYLPSASKVVSLALPRVRQQDFDDIQFLEPFYIKKTDAERNYAKGNAL
ncbi:tRNA (adenosine(37)-N6)-threonylcarbamoyltransferase complex dimerization subunit type 1 TsaB [candidate division WOR-3 bacterium]|nr:tRNA (adenosine(37)-N6)-threonylcarbamoyltransferase complex dimerization subunit type 1 TsaB [candidate division WOR-3 bacterium]